MTTLLDDLAILEDAITRIAYLLSQVVVIKTDCEITGRGLTEKEVELITWAHEQTTIPQRGKLNHHCPYPRLTK